MEKADSKRSRKKHEVWIGNELICNAPKDPKDIVWLIRERRSKTPAQRLKDRIAADLRDRGRKP